MLRFRISLKILASERVDFITHISNIPADMAIKVYVISNSEAIQYCLNDDVEGFKEYPASDEMLAVPSAEYLDTEAETLAFCVGIGYGTNERATPDFYPLRS